MTKTPQHLLPYSACIIGTQSKCKCNNHFKIIECCPTCRSDNIASLGRHKGKCSTHLYCSDSSSERRGYHPEQLHQFHFRHPNITIGYVRTARFIDCYYCSFHTPIILQIFHKLYSQTLIYRVQVWY